MNTEQKIMQLHSFFNLLKMTAEHLEGHNEETNGFMDDVINISQLGQKILNEIWKEVSENEKIA